MIVDVEEVFYGMGTVISGHFPLINESRFGLSEYQTRSDFHKLVEVEADESPETWRTFSM